MKQGFRRVGFAGAIVAALMLSACGGPVSISTNTLPNAIVGQAYNQTLQGNNVNSWFVVDGTLPPGLSMSESGVITGVPTTIGEYPFTIEADQEVSPFTPVADKAFVIVVTTAG